MILSLFIPHGPFNLRYMSPSEEACTLVPFRLAVVVETKAVLNAIPKSRLTSIRTNCKQTTISLKLSASPRGFLR